LQLVSGTISRAGQAARVSASLRTQFSTFPKGTVRLMEGATTLATQTIASSSSTYWSYPKLSATGLSPGTHTLRFVFDGDVNHLGTSIEFQHTVLPADTGVWLIATGFPDHTRLEFLNSTTPGASHYVYRRTAGGAWTLLDWASDVVFGDSNVVPGTSYQYQVRALTNNQIVDQSNVETVYVGPFTDPNLSGAIIKKMHFTDLQTAVNTFRTMAGLSPLQINFTGSILASHITQMRNAINEARSALAMPIVAFGEPPTAGVTRIRALDLHQLRDALR
jgi:hypothetical protein